MAVTLLVPIHSFQPEHWTLLQFDRAGTSEDQEPASFSVQHRDSLPQPSKTGLEVAQQMIRLMAMLLQPAKVAIPENLPVMPSRKQTFGWSCGFGVLL